MKQPAKAKNSSQEMLITLFNPYFESITEWFPETLGLYKIIFDAAYGSLVLSLLLFTLGNSYTMGTQALPDIYTLADLQPSGKCAYIRYRTCAHGVTNCSTLRSRLTQ